MVPVLVGFAQGDRPAPLQFVGMACAIVGIVLAARESDPTDIEGHPEPPSRRRIGPGVVYALVAAVFVGLLVAFLGAAGQGSAPWAAFMVRVVSVPLFVIAVIVRRAHERAPTGKETATLIVVGGFDNLANVTFALAAQTGHAGARLGGRVALSGVDRPARARVPARAAVGAAARRA